MMLAIREPACCSGKGIEEEEEENGRSSTFCDNPLSYVDILLCRWMTK
jgi:hypothetical protein